MDITADDADFALSGTIGDGKPAKVAIGSNSGDDVDFGEFAGTEINPLDILSGTAQSKLKSFIERLERLHTDRQAVMDDIKEVMAEAKGEGFDVKIIRTVLKIRAMDKARKAEEDALTELYLTALEDFVAG
jgi:uncharacterized protein (UPF0335 family)